MEVGERLKRSLEADEVVVLVDGTTFSSGVCDIASHR